MHTNGLNPESSIARNASSAAIMQHPVAHKKTQLQTPTTGRPSQYKQKVQTVPALF